jgi:hypothetical protein
MNRVALGFALALLTGCGAVEAPAPKAALVETAASSAAPAETPPVAAPASAVRKIVWNGACDGDNIDLGQAIAAGACKGELVNAKELPAWPETLHVKTVPATLSVRPAGDISFYLVLTNEGTTPLTLSIPGVGPELDDPPTVSGFGLGVLDAKARSVEFARNWQIFGMIGLLNRATVELHLPPGGRVRARDDERCRL